jgi:hypothetical protein
MRCHTSKDVMTEVLRQGLRMKIPPSKFQSRNHARPLRSSFWRLCAPALNHYLLKPMVDCQGRRAGVFCASGTEFTPDTTAELPAGLGTARPPQHFQTRRVIRRLPPSAFRLFLRRTHPPYGWAGCRAGVFCASETEFIPDTTAELPAGLGTLGHPNASKPGG